MNLDWISKIHRDEDGIGYEVHFLADLDTDRIYGYVEYPRPQDLTYISTPYKGENRWYLKAEPAKAYLEALAIVTEGDDSQDFKEFAETGRVKAKDAIQDEVMNDG